MAIKKVFFDIKELLPIGFTLIVLGIGLAYGLQVMGDVATDECTDNGGVSSGGNCYHNVSLVRELRNEQFNATTQTIEAVAKIPAKLGTVVTVIMAAVVIGVLLNYLYARFVR